MKSFSIVALACALAAAPLAAQSAEQAQQPQLPAQIDTSVGKMLDDAERDRAAGQLNDRAARLALQHYGRCVAARSPGEAGRVLSMNFTTATYRTGLRLLGQDAARSCAHKSFGTGVLRSANLLFAGEVAEALVEQTATPVAARLAKAAAAAPTTGYSITDKVALCVARSVPDQVGALFATERDSTQETAAVSALNVPLQMCARAAQATKPLSVSPAGLRAMLATATYRSIASVEATS